MTQLRTFVVVILSLLLLSTLGWAQAGSERDREQTAQLRKAYRQVDGLDSVTVEVRGGIVVLRGQVPSLESSVEAEELARKLDGILAVDNGLEVERELGQRISPVFSNFYEKGQTILSYLPLLGVALALFFSFVWFGRTLTKWNWIYSRLSKNVFVQDLLKQVFYGAMALLGAILALEILDATALVGAVLGTAGVLGVAVGFAFKDLAENSLASVLLSLRQPFSPNDHVVIDGAEGKVVRLTSRATILLTLDGNHLRIPNAAVFKATILNYTKNPERRFSFAVGIDTEENLPRAQELALRTLQDSPGVMSAPPPQCLIQELGDSTVNLKMIGWVEQTDAEYLKVKSEAIRRVKEAFDEAGVFMPEPIYKIRLEQSEPGSSKEPVRSKESASGVVSTKGADISPETHLERRIEEERVLEEKDLLSSFARQE
jgi:small conductance mechanosensitive channel